MTGAWQFWIDRGGTFTDVIALTPQNQIVVRKYLSDNPAFYKDASLFAIENMLRQSNSSMNDIAAVKMGTTVGTNALLERKGEKTLLLTTAGFADALRIAYQNRPNIFALNIKLPEQLFAEVLEIDERISADGEILIALDEDKAKAGMKDALTRGFSSCAILLMHSYGYPAHEARLAAIAHEIGFTQVSPSHEIVPLIKFVGRGDTTLVDAYLTPVLRSYRDRLAERLKHTPLLFMQSNGGLVGAGSFRGRDCILSGPAGGLVGAVKTCQRAGYDSIIGFDMGGTSTDVSHFSGTIERSLDNLVAGVRIRAPMVAVHTVAAGGGSILHFDGSRLSVGPDSAGSNPGPASYRNGGPLTITDANLLLAKIDPEHFPAVFGQNGKERLDLNTVKSKFDDLTNQINEATGTKLAPEEVAEGYVQIAVRKMAQAIKHISIQRGHHLEKYVLCSFGGAGGQHACLIAELLGIRRIFSSPYAGVLSALGIGLADQIEMRELSIAEPAHKLDRPLINNKIEKIRESLEGLLKADKLPPDKQTLKVEANLKYAGSDFCISLPYSDNQDLCEEFHQTHKQRYGFADRDCPVILDYLSIEVSGSALPTNIFDPETSADKNYEAVENMASGCTTLFSKGKSWQTKTYLRDALNPGCLISGPAIIFEESTTTVVEPGWTAHLDQNRNLLLEHIEYENSTPLRNKMDLKNLKADPIYLELFNNLFMFIAEQMGFTLQYTSHSVNIKERLDFSCALFDREGNLVANAPHMPVHLGSMGESVKSLIANHLGRFKPGDCFAHNDPMTGGTHLPDITVVSPVFVGNNSEADFFVASRGHHADIGGITPGSMPANSKTLQDEGAIFRHQLLVRDGKFLEDQTRSVFLNQSHPARNVEQNIADLKAQVAANTRGIQELEKLCSEWGIGFVKKYMDFVQDHAADCLRRALTKLKSGSYTCSLDEGSQIAVKITIAGDRATIDFSGTSPQTKNNFNAPLSVSRAAVLYVFRTLIEEDIPLNAGCFRPLEIIVPPGSLLNPDPDRAVVAGNVETSQIVVDTVYAALNVLAASQGTMNNLTFGNDKHQYYETICGGAGAGANFDGCDAVQTHMTNSRLTDPEILETRFPVLLESFSIRRHSGGQGRHRGGDGAQRTLRFLEPMTVSLLANRRQTIPHGLDGGAPGLPGKDRVRKANGKEILLESRCLLELDKGDCLTIESPGGGAFGKE